MDRAVIGYLFSAVIGSGMLMMPNDFLHDEVQEFFGEIGVEMGIDSQSAKTLDLTLFASRVSRGEAPFGLQHAHCLCAAEAFGQHMDQRRINIVDGGTQ
jgi:hypothetical protein